MQLAEADGERSTPHSNAYPNGIWVTARTMPDYSLHAHARPHLTLLLRGAIREQRGPQRYERQAGQTVFFYGQEPHQSDRTLEGSRNLNLEFDPGFFRRVNLREDDLQAAVQHNAGTSAQLLKAYQEFVTNDQFSADSVLMSLLVAVDRQARARREPAASWLGMVEELLRDRWNEPVSLQDLSVASGRHPVTISRQFHHYLGCTLGEYMRRLKVERALTLIRQPGTSLAAVAYECGFSDQSHFGRVFHQLTGFRPVDYKRL